MKNFMIFGHDRVVDGRHDPTFDSFCPSDGVPIMLVRGPEDARLELCREYGAVELSCGKIDHVGPEALAMFALDEDDPDFTVVAEYVPLDIYRER